MSTRQLTNSRLTSQFLGHPTNLLKLMELLHYVVKMFSVGYLTTLRSKHLFTSSFSIQRGGRFSLMRRLMLD